MKTERDRGESLAICGNLEANTDILKLHQVDFLVFKTLINEAFLSICRISMLGLELDNQEFKVIFCFIASSLSYKENYKQ